MARAETQTVVVLGMHRSGTSMLAGILDALGIDMGGQDTSNPCSPFEDADFLALNERLLGHAGATWDRPPVRDALEKAAAKEKSTIERLVETRTARAKSWGWKEPRSSLTIEWFYPYLRSPKFIVCRRDEVQVVRSLARRNHLSYNQGMKLKAQYDACIGAFLETHPGQAVLELSYSDIVKEPQEKIDKIIDFLALRPPKKQKAAAIGLVEPRDDLTRSSSKLASNMVRHTALPHNQASARMQRQHPGWPLVSSVVLSLNTLEETKASVHALQSMEYPNHEIIVVDNGSVDGSKEWLREKTGIILIDLPENTGFTGGNLIAEREARGKYLGLINSDAVVAKDWASRLVEVAESDPTIGALGGKRFSWSERFPAFDTNNPFHSFHSVDEITGYTATETYGEHQQVVHSQSAAALLVAREAINKVGYFDNRFFAYFEETDLIARMMRAGLSAVYVPGAHVWHKISASSKGHGASDFVLRQMARNRFIFAVKNFDGDYVWKFFWHHTRQFFYSLPRCLEGDRRARATLEAYLWNLGHIGPALRSRREVQKLGPTYSRKLTPYAIPDEVTVIISNYNYARHVTDALDSVRAQTHKAKEIIVIDDGSTDNSREVLDSHDEGVRVIYKKNEGVVATKNLGIQLSRTFWTVFLDADDVLDERYLQKTVAKAQEDELDVVYSDMRMFGAKDALVKGQEFDIQRLLKLNYIHNSSLIKSSFLKRCGGYKLAMSDGYEDWELYLNLASCGAKMGYIPEALVRYRQHEEPARNSQAQAQAKPLKQKIRGLHPALYAKYAPAGRASINQLGHGIKRIVEHPWLIVIIVFSLPQAVVASLAGAVCGAASVIARNSRRYLRNKHHEK